MKLTIIGASGHGKVVADIARLNGYDEIEFLDDDLSKDSCSGYKIVGNTKKVISGDCIVAVGDACVRSKLLQRLNAITLIHPASVVAKDVVIGRGTVLMAGTVINPGARLGEGCIVNTCASVDHDCVIGDYTHISVGAHLSGTVTVGNKVWIGAGAIVSNNISICDDCIIGAGAVVVNDLTEPGTYIGVPAKKFIK